MTARVGDRRAVAGEGLVIGRDHWRRSSNVGIRRVFLGWRQRAAEAVADYLWDRFAQDGTWDLGDVVLVLPGGRAGRRLIERLAERASAAGRSFFPPHVTTVGRLPELLYACRRPFATPMTQRLAWTTALRSASDEVIGQFLAEPPPEEDDPRWWELGTLLWRQHRELAADGLSFTDVAQRGSALQGFTERARWQALAHIQQDYLRRLEDLGLWDRQTARLYAIEHRECEIQRRLFLVGTVDLNRALRQMLDQVTDQVTALVYAEPELSERFDAVGCLVPQAWQEAEISLRDEQIYVVDRPSDQASEVARILAREGAALTATEVTVGVPDESAIPLLQRVLAAAGASSRFGPGRSIEAVRPVRLLRSAAEYLNNRSLSQLADLVRHPDLLDWLSRTSDSLDDVAEQLASLDRYLAERLPSEGQGEWMVAGAPSRSVQRLADRVDAWLAPMRNPQTRDAYPQPPADWAPAIWQTVASIYSHWDFQADDPNDRWIWEGCQRIREGLDQLRQLPDELAPPVSAAEAILMSLQAVSDRQISAPPREDAVQLLGWLELPLDDAPFLIVTQMNEGYVPTSASSDLFLPNSLRMTLGLNDNARRYARDAYALTVLSRTRELRLIVGRRDAHGNPLLPSRLLFATDDQRLRERCLRIFDPSSDVTGGTPPEMSNVAAAADSESVETGGERVAAAHGFYVPRPGPDPCRKVDVLNVTDFKAYLECPYRFYLTRVLGLASVPAQPSELDAASFGSLLHQVLEQFGASPERDSDDADEIRESLVVILQDVFQQQFGTSPRPVLQIQRAQMQQRLEAFAVCQANWRREGWRIVMTESGRQSFSTQWLVDGQPITLRGRIDRIDQHRSGQYAVLDYKSSESSLSPAKAHNVGSEPYNDPSAWRDLQLPMYRHLMCEMGLSDSREVQLGFVTLPRKLDEVRFRLASWTQAELAAADEAARQVIRSLRQGRFWEPSESEPSFDVGIDRICQVGVFDRQWERQEVASGDPA